MARRQKLDRVTYVTSLVYQCVCIILYILPYITIYYHILPYITIYYHILPYITIYYHILPICIIVSYSEISTKKNSWKSHSFRWSQKHHIWPSSSQLRTKHYIVLPFSNILGTSTALLSHWFRPQNSYDWESEDSPPSLAPQKVDLQWIWTNRFYDWMHAASNLPPSFVPWRKLIKTLSTAPSGQVCRPKPSRALPSHCLTMSLTLASLDVANKKLGIQTQKTGLNDKELVILHDFTPKKSGWSPEQTSWLHQKSIITLARMGSPSQGLNEELLYQNRGWPIHSSHCKQPLVQQGTPKWIDLQYYINTLRFEHWLFQAWFPSSYPGSPNSPQQNHRKFAGQEWCSWVQDPS